jgi:VWFA-related protein
VKRTRFPFEGFPMHPLRLPASLVFAGLLIAASPAYLPNQAAPAAASQTQAQPTQTAQSTDTAVLRTNSNLVVVDVVATEHGKPVHGLERSRFHIFEDGREQAITSFDEHSPAAAASTAGAASPAPLPPHTYTNASAWPESGAVNVLLLDALNTPVASQMDVRRQMLQYMSKIAPGTSLAIFTLASRLRMVAGFTTNVPELTRALQGSKAGAQASVVLDPQSGQAVDSVVGDLGALGANSSAIAAMQQFQADLTAYQTDQRVTMTMDAMGQLARYLSGVPGRKNLIWFSGSFPIAIDPDDSQSNPFEAARNYTDQLRETNELLTAARVAVYPVDARGLMTVATTDVTYAPTTNLTGGGTSPKGRAGAVKSNPMNRPNVAKDQANATKQMMLEQAAMEQIAKETGGKAFVNTNGLKEAVAEAVENGSSYYSIGYVPTARDFDGRFRKIQLRVDNAAYDLAYRDGYYADSLDKPSARTLNTPSLIMAATLHGAPASTQILFQARVLDAADPQLKGAKLPEGLAGEAAGSLKGPLHRVVADVTVDAHGLRYQETANGGHSARVEFTLVAYDPEGKRLN